ncbi:MAG: class I SAM-dependent methyltransferase [Defluviitaleaceae bacterium]|nr:class I SAM-dependent methyltransferase [Defluviitaleaceae bacterium]
MNTELFTGKAAHYAAARPGYPAEAIDYICSLVPADAVFADIGAGTGLFTREPARRGYKVFAVEPNPDMSAQLKRVLKNAVSYDEFAENRRLQAGFRERAYANGQFFNTLLKITTAPYNVTVISAPAEATTLPAHSADIITCAQALHWFDLPAFEKECRRIGKPGAIIAAIYNATPGGSSITHSQCSTEIFFKNPTIKEFPNPVFYTREKWIAYMSSHSHDPLPTSPEYAEHLAKVNAVFDAENIDGLLRREVVTKVYSERRGHV